MAEEFKPQPHPRHPQDTIRVKNPTNKDFEFFWEGLPHTVLALSEASMPRYLAVHYAKKMIVSIINSKIKKVKMGDQYVDSLRTDDPEIRRQLVPHILLYVEKYFVAPPKPERKPSEVVEVTPESYSIPADKRASSLKIELPESVEKLFGGIEELEKASPPEPVAETAPGAPKLPQGDVSSAEPTKEPTEGKKPKRSHQDLLNELTAMGIETTGQETSEELEQKILAGAR